jgi:hypothetical protein
MKEIKVTVYTNGLHIPIWNRTKKPFGISLSKAGRGVRERDNGGNVINVQYKSNQNITINAPLYNEYILIKNFT